jgi:hypothetical protein
MTVSSYNFVYLIRLENKLLGLIFGVDGSFKIIGFIKNAVAGS